MYTNDHSTIIHTSQQVETTQISIKQWINKAWYTQSVDASYSMGESENTRPRERSQSQKTHIYDFICVKYPK